MSDNRAAYEKKNRILFILRVLGILLVVALIGGGAFKVFQIQSDGRYALRTAKNVRIALETTGIEYRGMNRSIYSANTQNGLNTGVLEQVEKLVGAEGEIRLQSYDPFSNVVYSMSYRQGQYLVTYERDKDGVEDWVLEYIIPLDIS